MREAETSADKDLHYNVYSNKPDTPVVADEVSAPARSRAGRELRQPARFR